MTSSDRYPAHAPGAGGSLRKQDWAYEQIREWIINGELPPGSRIEQEQLATRLSISRIPLREGLARLSAEGLLHGRAHQRLIVTELTLEDARDVYCGREALEGVLAAEAATRAGGRELSELRTILDAQRSLLSAGDADDFRRCDRDFHHAVYRLAGMPKTFNAVTGLFAMSQRYVRLYLSDADRTASSYREHAEILAAIEAGDGDLAARLTREHVRRGLVSLEETLRVPAASGPD